VEDEKLIVYSSGATAPPLRKLAETFTDRFGIEFEFTVGRVEKLFSNLLETEEGDILQCGAEYIFDEAEHKGLIVKGSRRSVGYRRSVILVTIGNPKKISTLDDLVDDGVRIGISASGCLVGVWDDICSKAGVTNQVLKNITHLADGCGAVMSLIHEKKVDAIFGWDAFEDIWPKTSEAVEIPYELQVLRSTGVAILNYSKRRRIASKFIDFLLSEEGREVYEEYGWTTHTLKRL
jgi:molybdate transport system substrate-binding protein